MTRRSALFNGASAILLLLLLVTPEFQGDTETLLVNVHNASACLAHGVWIGCDSAGKFAPLQFSIAWVLSALGLKDFVILSLLAHSSVLWFALSLKLAYDTLKDRSESLAWLTVAALAASPYVTYGRSSFGEMLAAYVTLGVISSVLLLKSSRRIFWMTFLAALTKDTAGPFLLIIGVAAASVHAARKGAFKRSVIGLLAGVAASMVVLGAFNYFRFGVPYNSGYLEPLLLVHDFKTQLSFFFAIWFSPSGGVLFFLPLITLLIFWACINERSKRSGVILGILVLLTVGFSKWFAPLGWTAWGPRLMLPWLPALLVFALFGLSKQSLGRLYRWVQRWRGAAYFGLVLAGIPHFLFLFNPGLLEVLVASPPGIASGRIEDGPAGYYPGLLAALWKPDFSLYRLGLWPHGVLAAVMVVPYLGLLYMLLERARKAKA